MASLRVKSLHSFEELRNYSLGLGPSSSCRKKNGFVNYNSNNNHKICRAPPRLIVRAGVVNNAYCTDSSSWNSATSPSRLSLFDHYGSQLESLATRRGYKRADHKGKVDSGKLDKWVKDSVGEIVNNLEEAPFLVHIYSDGEEGSASPSKTRLVSEKAAAESWPLIKRRLGAGSATPTGIILVQQMENSEEVGAVSSPDGQNLGSSPTKVWGVLIQGKGLTCPACYILKTCKVRSVIGFCTHFCLVRVECFFETVDIQLKNLWLV